VRWYLATSDTAVFWGFGDVFNLSTGLSITFSTWLHVLVVYDPIDGQIQNYLNGVSTANNTYSGNAVFASRNTEIGDIRDVSVPFRGKIDDIRVFDIALNATDAAALATGRGANVA
jgi:hypothetical protein